MSVPRNLASKKPHRTNVHILETKLKETICQKHSLSVLTFNSCHFIDMEGNINEIECESIVGNLQHSLLWIKVKEVKPVDGTYDIFTLQKENPKNREVEVIVQNKHMRRFLGDVKKKFKICMVPNIRYVQLKVETTLMISDNARIYQVDNKDYIIIGHLSIKSKYIDTYYPAKTSEQLLKSQEEFINRLTNDTSRND